MIKLLKALRENPSRKNAEKIQKHLRRHPFSATVMRPSDVALMKEITQPIVHFIEAVEELKKRNQQWKHL